MLALAAPYGLDIYLLKRVFGFLFFSLIVVLLEQVLQLGGVAVFAFWKTIMALDTFWEVK